jgi:hypothetical protein
MTNKINIELYFTGKDTEFLIDTTITKNNKFHSHWHLESLKQLNQILRAIK